MENKLMIKLVVGTESMFFLSLIMAFVYFSLIPGFKLQQVESLNVTRTGLFTILLVGSSFTYRLVESNFNKGKIGSVKIWLFCTILLGAFFLFGQLSEYLKLIHEHISVSSSLFGTGFFTLTGFHGLHVFIGLIALIIIASLVFMGDYNHDHPCSSVINAVGIYWHFVDIVWLIVFFIVYVLPRLN